MYRFYPDSGIIASHTVALSLDSFLEPVPKAQEVEGVAWTLLAAAFSWARVVQLFQASAAIPIPECWALGLWIEVL